MVLLIDANVIIDYLLQRKPFFDDAYRIMRICSDDTVDGYVSLNSVTTIWYILRKEPEIQRRAALNDICELLKVVSASHDDVVDAIRQRDFRDFEDCIQSKCAKAAGADYIITRNTDDFAFSEVPAVTPGAFLQMYDLQ